MHVLKEFGRISIPTELKIDDKDINDEATFKKKFAALIDYLKENHASEKQLASTVYTMYYGIVGSTFYSNGVKHHGMQVTYLTNYINDYCTDKQKKNILKDIDKTIAALAKMEAKGKELNTLQKDWLKDIKSAKQKIK